jgi:NADH:ubiquinone oxidoreductase subunit E
VNCAARSIAPVVIVNKTVHGKMTPDKIVKEMKTLKAGEQHTHRIQMKSAKPG